MERLPMARAVIYESFGGPEVLKVREIAEPHAGEGELRIRTTAASLNPMDWKIASAEHIAAYFNVSLPAGFGYDFAGIIDEVGPGTTGYEVGTRVFGGMMAKAIADYIVVKIPLSQRDVLKETPTDISDEVASTLTVAGCSAIAALKTIGLRAGDTLLVGGAAGGVGIFLVQLAKLAGARVIGTASPSTFDFLSSFGVEPVAYGPGLSDRVKALAPEGISTATDLMGTETLEAALALGVEPERISTIAAGPNPPGGARPTGASEAPVDALERVAAAISAKDLVVPIVGKFPIEKIQEAVAQQAEGHVHGKLIITMM